MGLTGSAAPEPSPACAPTSPLPARPTPAPTSPSSTPSNTDEPCTQYQGVSGGLESCVGVREGVGEALTGVRAGWAIEPRNQLSGADAVKRSGRQHRQQRYRELLTDPARSENLGMYGAFMRENRESPCPPVAKVTAGRLGNAKAVRPE